RASPTRNRLCKSWMRAHAHAHRPNLSALLSAFAHSILNVGSDFLPSFLPSFHSFVRTTISTRTAAQHCSSVSFFLLPFTHLSTLSNRPDHGRGASCPCVPRRRSGRHLRAQLAG